MGVSAACHRFLMQESKKRSFGGDLLTLGRQDIWINDGDFNRIAAEEGSGLRATASSSDPMKAKPGLASRNMDDKHYFSSLGFGRYKSLDADEYEGADIIFDLGQKELPDSLAESADTIIDIGVLEHCFDIPTALNNIYKMLRVGGRAVFWNPVIQQVDAGFYFFQPTFFYDYFFANDWEIDRVCIYAFPIGKWHNDDCNTIIEYEPGLFDLHAFGLDGRRYGIHTVVTKLPGSTGDRHPHQRRYQEVWEMSQIKSEMARILRKNRLAGTYVASSMDLDQMAELIRLRLMHDALSSVPMDEAKTKLRDVVNMYLKDR